MAVIHTNTKKSRSFFKSKKILASLTSLTLLIQALLPAGVFAVSLEQEYTLPFYTESLQSLFEVSEEMPSLEEATSDAEDVTSSDEATDSEATDSEEATDATDTGSTEPSEAAHSTETGPTETGSTEDSSESASEASSDHNEDTASESEDTPHQDPPSTDDTNDSEDIDADEEIPTEDIQLRGPNDVIPDMNFRKCINKALDKGGDNINPISQTEMKRLQQLVCRNMNIASIEGIQYATNLTVLNVSSNQITGPLPETLFAGLTNLKELSFSSNQITGPLPETLFAGLTNLKELSFSNNKITGPLPEKLFAGLTNLKELSFSNNKITGPLPEKLFAGLTSLTRLDFYYNQITGPLPEKLFAGLKNLTKLDFSNNKITGPLPETLFEGLTNLKELNFAKNEIKGPLTDNTFANNPQLETLIFFYNKITGPLPETLFAGLTNLTELSFSNNKITGPLPETLFAGLTNLKELDFSKNQITGELPETLFEGLTNLKYLNFAKNEIKGSLTDNTFANNPQLETLIFSENEIEGFLTDNTFVNNTKLQWLGFDNNDISGELPLGVFTKLENLKRLEFDNNDISGELPSGVFTKLEKLTWLDFSENSFSGSLPADIFKKNILLKNIYFDGNQITGALDENIFAGLSNLQILYFNNNQISSIPAKAPGKLNSNDSSGEDQSVTIVPTAATIEAPVHMGAEAVSLELTSEGEVKGFQLSGDKKNIIIPAGLELVVYEKIATWDASWMKLSGEEGASFSGTIHIDLQASFDPAHKPSINPVKDTDNTITGNGAKGEKITVTVGENTYETTVEENGTWKVNVPADKPLEEGQVVNATAANPDSGKTEDADPVTVSHDTTVDPAHKPSINPVKDTDNTITGNGAKGEKITVTVGENTYETTVEENGTWKVNVPADKPLEEGQVVNATAANPDSGKTEDADPVTVSHDTTVDPAHKPSINPVKDTDNTITGNGAKGEKITVTVGENTYETTVEENGTWKVNVPADKPLEEGQVVNATAANPDSGKTEDADPVTVSHDTTVDPAHKPSINPVKDTDNTITGNGAKGEKITVTVGENTYETTVEENGTWKVNVPADKPLEEGQVVNATAANPDSGKTEDADPVTVSHDTTVDPAHKPSINPVKDTDNTITGNGAKGEKITVTVGENTYETTVEENGTWKVNVPADKPLEEGQVVNATAANPDSGKTEDADPVTVSHDTTVDPAHKPSINPVKDTDNTITGNGAKGEKITVTVGENTYETTVEENGTWKVNVPADKPLEEGQVVNATAANPDSGKTEDADPVTVSHDTTVDPAHKPSINPVKDTDNTITGNGAKGEKITVTVGENTYETTVEENGTWKVNVPADKPLEEGQVVNATAANPDSGKTEDADPVTVSHDTTVDPAHKPSINPVKDTDNTITGNGAKGEKITVTVGENTYETTVEENGTWKVNVPADKPLEEGQVVNATAANPDSGKTEDADPVTVSHDTTVDPAHKPSINPVKDTDNTITGNGAKGEKITVTVGENTYETTVEENGTWKVNVPADKPLEEGQVVNATAANPDSGKTEDADPVTVSHDTTVDPAHKPSINPVKDTDNTITGNGAKGEKITVTVGENTYETTVEENGTWKVNVPADKPLEEGQVVNATAANPDSGKTEDADPVTVSHDTTVDPAHKPSINPVKDTDNTITGNGAKGEKITVTVGENTYETTVEENGTWKVNVPADKPLEEGQVVNATAANPDSGKTEDADPVTVSHDTTVDPAHKPSINPVKDTDNTITGNGAKGEKITVTVGENTYETTVEENGTWKVNVPADKPLEEGQVVNATAANPDSGKTEDADPVTVSHDTTVDPAHKPSINPVKDTDNTITGNGAKGEKITVTVGENTYETTVEENGTWKVNVPADKPLEEGQVVNATAANPDSGKTEDADPVTVSHDTTVDPAHKPSINPVKDTDNTITGNGAKGEKITVTVGENTYETTVEENGTWKVNVPADKPLEEGQVVNATAANPDSGKTEDADPVTVSHDTTVDPAHKPSINPVKDTDNTITGNGAKGEKITVTVGENTYETTVEENGTWKVNVPADKPLEEGQVVNATAANPDSGKTEDADPVTVSHDTTVDPAHKPSINPVKDTDNTITGNGAKGEKITVTVGENTYETTVEENGTWKVNVPADKPLEEGQVVNATAANPDSGKTEDADPVTVSHDTTVDPAHKPSINPVKDTDNTITGNGAKGEKITVTVGENTYETTVEENGTWKVNVPADKPLEEGQVVNATAANPDSGNTADADQVIVTHDTSEDVTSLTVQGTIKDADMVLVSGTTDSGATVTIGTETIIASDGTFAILIPRETNNKTLQVTAKHPDKKPAIPQTVSIPAKESTTPGGGGSGGGGYDPSSHPSQTIIPSVTPTPQPTFTDPSQSGIRQPEIIPTFSSAPPDPNGNTFINPNPVGQNVCTKIVRTFKPRELIVQDIGASPYDGNIRTLMMYRGAGEDESSPAFSLQDKNFGVVLNVENFEPNRSLTRAEFVKILIRSLACRYTFMGTEANFPDVHSTLWYSEYLTYAFKNKWIKGYEDGLFRPDRPISRKEILLIIERAVLPYDSLATHFQDLNNPDNTTDNEDYMNAPMPRDQVASVFAKVFFEVRQNQVEEYTQK